MVYDNIPTLVSMVLFLLRVCNCLQTLAKAAVSLLEHSTSDDYHKEYHFSYISLHSIKAYDLPISLSHNRYFRQFWGTATFTSESLHTARCNSLYL